MGDFLRWNLDSYLAGDHVISSFASCVFPHLLEKISKNGTSRKKPTHSLNTYLLIKGKIIFNIKYGDKYENHISHLKSPAVRIEVNYMAAY